MIKTSFKALLLTLFLAGSAAAQVVTGGGGGGTPGSSPGGTVTVNPLNSGAKFNGHRVKDATTIISSGVITCPNNDCNFTTTGQAVPGQIIYCTTAVINAGATPLNIGTISTVNGAQSITSTGLSASNKTATAICAWGTDDSTALNTAWNNLANLTANTQALIFYQMPAGITFTHTCLWNSTTYPNDSTLDAYTSPTIAGAGRGSTIIIPVPMITQGGTFDLTTCPAGAAGNLPPMFGPSGSSCNTGSVNYRDFTIDGMGNSLSGTNMNGGLSVLGSGGASNPCGLTDMKNVACVGYGANATNLFGLRTGGIQSVYQDSFFDGCGPKGVLVRQPLNAAFQLTSIIFRNMFVGDTSGDSVTVENGAALASFSSTYGPSQTGKDVIVDGIFNSYMDGVINTPGGVGGVFRCENSAVCNSNGSKWTTQVAGNFGCVMGTSAVFIAISTTCTSSGGGGGISLSGDNTAKIIDLGGNIWTSPNSVAGYIAEGHSVKGTCTGSATASTTLGLYGTGPNAVTTTCNSATIGLGIPVSGARTLQNLYCTVGVAGTTASTCTVLVNGGASIVTCTIAGAATNCLDGTHTVALNDGDRISLEFISGAVTTPQGVQMIVEWN